jgi:hypothetical protein
VTLKIVTTVGNELEATMVGGVLTDAGIRSMQQLCAGGGRTGAAGARDVYVE